MTICLHYIDDSLARMPRPPPPKSSRKSVTQLARVNSPNSLAHNLEACCRGRNDTWLVFSFLFSSSSRLADHTSTPLYHRSAATEARLSHHISAIVFPRHGPSPFVGLRRRAGLLIAVSLFRYIKLGAWAHYCTILSPSTPGCLVSMELAAPKRLSELLHLFSRAVE